MATAAKRYALTNLAAADTAPAQDAIAVTPDDTNDLTYITRALYVGVTGDVKVNMASGAVVTFKAVPAGVVLPIAASRVYTTGTTATNMLALY